MKRGFSKPLALANALPALGSPPWAAALAALLELDVGTRLPLGGGVFADPVSNTLSCRANPMLTNARSGIPSAEKKSIVSLNDSMNPWN